MVIETGVRMLINEFSLVETLHCLCSIPIACDAREASSTCRGSTMALHLWQASSSMHVGLAAVHKRYTLVMQFCESIL